MTSKTACLRMILLVAAALTSTAQAETVAVAVASNFIAPMQKIAAQFQRDTGHQAKLSWGSTGKLYAQIKHGAPFDVLLAADASTPEKIAQEGYADPASRFTYAVGKLVLWSRQAAYVDDQGQVLQQGQFQHLALANPKLAPYGVAAQQTLSHLGLLERTQPRWVQGENIGQTFQFVASGNAQLGFVALSQVIEGGQIQSGSAWIVPAHMHQPIRQDAVLLQRGQNNAAAQALMAYLRSDKARAIISAHGYGF